MAKFLAGQFDPPGGDIPLPYLALLSLALAAFAIGATELALQALLPEVAVDLAVDIRSAALLVSAFAISVAFGGPIIAALSGAAERKRTLLALMAVFVVGHILAATAPTYALLLLARIATACCVGAFFGIGMVVAVHISPPGRSASAASLMWMGLASANVIGVPASAAFGHAFGWRAALLAIAVIAAVSFVAMALLLPDSGRSENRIFLRQFAVLTNPRCLAPLAVGVLTCCANGCVFTYVVPLLTETAGVTRSALPLYLMVFGVGGVGGMAAGGRFADRDPVAAITLSFAALTVIYFVELVAFRSAVASLGVMLLWGFAFFFAAPAIQVRVLEGASEAPNLASTLVHSGFNIGAALGPALGAAGLSFGLGYARLPALAALLAVSALIISRFNPSTRDASPVVSASRRTIP